MMRKLRVFLHVLKHSLFPFDAYYKKIRKTHFSFSLKYFIGLIVLTISISVLLKAILFTSMFPPSTLKTYITKVAKEYPSHLIITMNENGRLSTNDDRPYILFSPLAHNPRPLIVVDPKADKEKIDQYDAFVVLTERKMYMHNDDSIMPITYETGHSFSFNKSKVQLTADNSQLVLNSYWKFVALAIVAAITVGIVFAGISSFLTLLMVAFVLWIALKLAVKHKAITFRSVLQICLHAFTGPLLIQSFAFIAGLTPGVEHWYGLILWVFVGGAIYESYFEKTRS
ncbi:DUF1189 family protein [Candidatus Woesebacteria bacterium]|nr:DUF1189 family protein [Candidatus Woesebacteria bacterium]